MSTRARYHPWFRESLSAPSAETTGALKPDPARRPAEFVSVGRRYTVSNVPCYNGVVVRFG